MTAPGLAECPGCGAQVLRVADRDVGEQLVVDAEPMLVATVEVYRAGSALQARRRGTPGRAPVHREHDCAWSTANRAAQLDADVAVAHAPADPGLEQARWRAP